jgi:hypothetical protein
VPQDGNNNGGIWNTFERYARSLVAGSDSVEVISGPVYAGKAVVLKENGIPIPTKMYKIIKCNRGGKSYVGAYEFLNAKTSDNDKTLAQFEVGINYIEKATGLSFSLGEYLPLGEMVGAGLEKKKADLDGEFFFNLMKNSPTLAEMDNSFRRAKEQHIHIDLSLLTERIKVLSKAETDSIQI